MFSVVRGAVDGALERVRAGRQAGAEHGRHRAGGRRPRPSRAGRRTRPPPPRSSRRCAWCVCAGAAEDDRPRQEPPLRGAVEPGQRAEQGQLPPQEACDYRHPLCELAHRFDPQERPVTLVGCQLSHATSYFINIPRNLSSAKKWILLSELWLFATPKNEICRKREKNCLDTWENPC